MGHDYEREHERWSGQNGNSVTLKLTRRRFVFVTMVTGVILLLTAARWTTTRGSVYSGLPHVQVALTNRTLRREQSLPSHLQGLRRSLQVWAAQENSLNVTGGIFAPLSWAENPCWVSSYPKQTLTSLEPYKINYRRYHRPWVQYEQQVRERLMGGDTSRFRCFPGIFLIGAPRCGTTDLYRKLTRNHSQIHDSFRKETFFFRDEWTSNDSLRTYLDTYDGAADSIYRMIKSNKKPYIGYAMDGCTHNMYEFNWQLVQQNQNLREPQITTAHILKALHPGVKAILMLRDPVERTYSHYKWRNRDTGDPERFHVLVIEEVNRWQQCFVDYTHRYCVYNLPEWSFPFVASIYFPFVKDWKDVLGDNLAIIKSEDYFQDRIPVLDNITQFLNIAPFSDEDVHKIRNSPATNTNVYIKHISDMKAETRKMLKDFFLPLNKLLAEYLKNHRFLWLSNK